MNIALITPPLGLRNTKSRPIGLAYIQSVLKQNGYNCKLYDFSTLDDSSALKVLQEKSYDVIGITVFSDGRHGSINFAKLLKEKNVCNKIVLGGHHPSFLHKQIMEHYDFIDFIIIGEGEFTFLELIKTLDSSKDNFKDINGLVFRRDSEYYINPPRKQLENIDAIPFPDYCDLDDSMYKAFTFPWYKKNYGIITSRSCSFVCNYCASKWFSGKWRARSVDNVIQEIEKVYSKQIKHIWIIDDSFTENPERAIAIFKQIIKKGLKIELAMNSRVNVCNEEILSYFKQAGGYRVDFGIETASPELASIMNKRVNLDKAFKLREACKKLNIYIGLNFMLGYPGETNESFNQTKNFIKQIKPDILTTSILRVFPGTPLYESLIREGKVTEEFWLGTIPGLHYFGESNYKVVMRQVSQILKLWALQFRLKSTLSLIAFFWEFIFDNPRQIVYHSINTLKSLIPKMLK